MMHLRGPAENPTTGGRSTIRSTRDSPPLEWWGPQAPSSARRFAIGVGEACTRLQKLSVGGGDLTHSLSMKRILANLALGAGAALALGLLFEAGLRLVAPQLPPAAGLFRTDPAVGF